MAKIKAPSPEQIIKAMALKGYRINEGILELNIVGLRSKERQADAFDDLIMVFYRRVAEALCVNYFPATTDPGLYYLQNPMNVKGTGILKPGQYRNAYRLGLHQGKYDALVQTGGPVTAIRDNDRDGELDTVGNLEESGLFGANIHRANPAGESVQVGKWSAMCQVIAHSQDFEIFMALIKAAAPKDKTFTYTLLDEADVYGVMA